MTGLRAVYRGEQQTAHHAAQVRDASLVDFGQRRQRQSTQVEVSGTLSLIVEAVGFVGAQCGACLLFQQRVFRDECGGHGGPPKLPYATKSILYPFISFCLTFKWVGRPALQCGVMSNSTVDPNLLTLGLAQIAPCWMDRARTLQKVE